MGEMILSKDKIRKQLKTVQNQLSSTHPPPPPPPPPPPHTKKKKKSIVHGVLKLVN